MPGRRVASAPVPISPDDLDHVDVARKVAGGGYKWAGHDGSVYPSFVAEHDLGPVPAMTERLAELVELGAFGYHDAVARLGPAFSGWMTRRHGWTPDPDLVLPTVSVLQGVWAVVEAFTDPGDGVLLTPPIYFPFNEIGPTTGRRTVDWPLVRDADGWHYDLDHLARLLADDKGIRLLVLCHPHNPTGRVLTDDQLARIVDLANEHDLVIASDEIHSDFVYPGAIHRPLPLIDGATERTVVLTSGVKTFAMGGLRCAVASFADEHLHARFAEVPAELLGGVNRLGCEALIAGWDTADEWVDALVALFDCHRHHLVERLADELPEVRVHLPESTFLAWLDLSAFEPGDRPGRWLRERTGVACKSGPPFGAGGGGHVRMTFGTSTAVLDEMLDRIVAGLAR